MFALETSTTEIIKCHPSLIIGSIICTTLDHLWNVSMKLYLSFLCSRQILRSVPNIVRNSPHRANFVHKIQTGDHSKFKIKS